jgi:uncharacterized protein (TIGR03083 family)
MTTYDVRMNYEQAVNGFIRLVTSVNGAHWSRPALGVWTVRDLVGHTSRALLTVESYLDPTSTTDDPSLPDAVAYFRAAPAGTLADPQAVAKRGRQAGAALGDRPAAAVATIAERVLALVDGVDDDALVRTPINTMTLIGYLPTRTFELVVHSLDLAAATNVELPAELARVIPACLVLAAQLAGERDDAAMVLLALTGRRPLPDGFSVV